MEGGFLLIRCFRTRQRSCERGIEMLVFPRATERALTLRDENLIRKTQVIYSPWICSIIQEQKTLESKGYSALNWLST